MGERVINIQVQWSDPDDAGARTFLGVTPFTRNDDGSDPPPIFIPKASLDPRAAAALETGTFPALLAARAACIAALEPPAQKVARESEEAVAAKVRAETDKAALDAQIVTQQATIADLDRQIADKKAALDAPAALEEAKA